MKHTFGQQYILLSRSAWQGWSTVQGKESKKSFIFNLGINDLLARGGGKKILPVLPQLIIPIKCKRFTKVVIPFYNFVFCYAKKETLFITCSSSQHQTRGSHVQNSEGPSEIR
jgi:hypothetical protein